MSRNIQVLFREYIFCGLNLKTAVKLGEGAPFHNRHIFQNFQNLATVSDQST